MFSRSESPTALTVGVLRVRMRKERNSFLRGEFMKIMVKFLFVFIIAGNVGGVEGL
jgi:hypothetical protein